MLPQEPFLLGQVADVAVVHKDALMPGDKLRVGEAQLLHTFAEVVEGVKGLVVDVEVAKTVLAEVFHSAFLLSSVLKIGDKLLQVFPVRGGGIEPVVLRVKIPAGKSPLLVQQGGIEPHPPKIGVKAKTALVAVLFQGLQVGVQGVEPLAPHQPSAGAAIGEVDMYNLFPQGLEPLLQGLPGAAHGTDVQSGLYKGMVHCGQQLLQLGQGVDNHRIGRRHCLHRNNHPQLLGDVDDTNALCCHGQSLPCGRCGPFPHSTTFLPKFLQNFPKIFAILFGALSPLF